MLLSIVLLFMGGINAASTVISVDATSPHISTSVDDYRCVCPEEQIYLTCHASDSWSLSWTSLEYVGQRAAIEFNQDFDRPGVGKLVSLPNGRATLAQMMKTERSISSDLKITIPSDLNETWVTCTNNYGAAVTKSFMLSKEPPTPPTFLPTEIIAENLASGINVYRFRWQLPANIENTDIKQMKFQVDQQLPILLMNNSTDIILPLSYPGQHSVNIVAVDRCDRQSQATILQLQVKNGVTGLTDRHNVNPENVLNCAKGIKPMLNVLLVLLSASVILIVNVLIL